MTGNLFSERRRGGEILRITAVEESVDYEDRGGVEVRCHCSRCRFVAVCQCQIVVYISEHRGGKTVVAMHFVSRSIITF